MPISGVVFFLSNCPLGIEGQKNLESLKVCPESLRAMLKYYYQTWPIPSMRYAYSEL